MGVRIALSERIEVISAHEVPCSRQDRIRDFRGVSPKSFDGRGNYTLGLKEQLIFPEIKYDEVASIHGMDITIVTTARTNDEGRALLKHLGMPFRTLMSSEGAAGVEISAQK